MEVFHKNTRTWKTTKAMDVMLASSYRLTCLQLPTTVTLATGLQIRGHKGKTGQMSPNPFPSP